MKPQANLRVACVLLVLLGCGKAPPAESRPGEPPAPASERSGAKPAGAPEGSGKDPGGGTNEAPAALEGSGAKKPLEASGEFGKNNASGPQLGPAVETGAPPRKPGQDLAEQIGGAAPARPEPVKRMPTRVTLANHRALDAASPDSSPIAARILGTGLSAIKRCYEGVLAGDPGATGALTLRFAVTTTGHLTDATAESWSAALSRCVLAAMRAWTFSVPRAQARYELVLSLVAE